MLCMQHPFSVLGMRTEDIEDAGRNSCPARIFMLQ